MKPSGSEFSIDLVNKVGPDVLNSSGSDISIFSVNTVGPSDCLMISSESAIFTVAMLVVILFVIPTATGLVYSLKICFLKFPSIITSPKLF